MDYCDNLYEQFEVPCFSYLANNKDTKRWQWNNCLLSFQKISNEKIRFLVRRKKLVSLSNNTKLRWDQKQKNPSSKWNKFLLHYIIHFDVNISDLPESIVEDKIPVQLTEKEYGDFRDSWILYLDTNHRIWSWKNSQEDTRIAMMKILDSINRKRTNEYVQVNRPNANNSIDKNMLPVIYHPSRDLTGTRNYIQEIHLNRSKPDNKIQVTIVYNDEQLRNNAIVDGIYRIVRKILHGRTFDVESFSISLDENGNASRYNFPDIYSGDNKLQQDNIHIDKHDLDIKYYFNNDISRPVLFINTSNHAMAEKDNNCDKWKIEYRLWEEQCPIYVGDNSRCEIEKYLSVHGLKCLFRKCSDSKYS